METMIAIFGCKRCMRVLCRDCSEDPKIHDDCLEKVKFEYHQHLKNKNKRIGSTKLEKL